MMMPFVFPLKSLKVDKSGFRNQLLLISFLALHLTFFSCERPIKGILSEEIENDEISESAGCDQTLEEPGKIDFGSGRTFEMSASTDIRITQYTPSETDPFNEFQAHTFSNNHTTYNVAGSRDWFELDEDSFGLHFCTYYENSAFENRGVKEWFYFWFVPLKTGSYPIQRLTGPCLEEIVHTTLYQYSPLGERTSVFEPVYDLPQGFLNIEEIDTTSAFYVSGNFEFWMNLEWQRDDSSAKGTEVWHIKNDFFCIDLPRP